MKSPILFLDRVIFPGQFLDVDVNLAAGRDLLALWNLERFGCVEAVIGFPADPARPASAENLAPIGVCAELLVDTWDVERGKALVRVSVGDSERVAIGELEEAPAAYRAAWPRPFAAWEPAPVVDVPADDAQVERVRRKATRVLLQAPELVATREAEQQRIPDAIVDLHATDVEPWRIAFLVAEIFLEDGPQRHDALMAPEMRALWGTLEAILDQRLAEATRAGAAETVEAWLAAATDLGLQGVLDSLEAAKLVADAGHLEIPSPLLKKLRRLHKDLEHLQGQLYELIEAVAEHNAPARSDDEDEE